MDENLDAMMMMIECNKHLNDANTIQCTLYWQFYKQPKRRPPPPPPTTTTMKNCHNDDEL
ncbi:hypothetical protein DERP_014184 [Dermatophagoides pteronyssinus]|uniref:Uncharacterized protein n=1 Tax=Dermatophagoides pteronyssinus TaxID=6956 RepID=A0ABQ8IWL8_DERPT|nr:hypothetical protein DERP_014184 [Dermatophagoides pteronyssinus]